MAMDPFDQDDEPRADDQKTPKFPWLLLIVLGLSGLMLATYLGDEMGEKKYPSLTRIKNEVARGADSEVMKIEATDEEITIHLKKNVPFLVEKLQDGEEIKAGDNEKRRWSQPINRELLTELDKTCKEHGVPLKYKRTNMLLRMIADIAPYVIVFLLFYWLIFRQMRSAVGGGFSFGKSRAKLHNPNKKRVTFKDVAGIEEAKEEVTEIIEFLKDPSRFARLGGRIPHGALLVGPPGTGKTLLAKAIAGEANRPFFSISGSHFVEMFVGVGASRVRDLFKQARDNAPCIIFLDEIDAVGRRRGSGLGGAHDEREQTLNAILVEMDGFESEEGIIVVAATNRPDVLDPALLRPGRFDRQVYINLPDLKGREEILKVHAKKVKFAADVDLTTVARGTPGFSGAELANLINEAALMAVCKEHDAVEMSDLEEARDKVRWGRQRNSRIIDDEEKKIIAYHEAGHAIVSKFLPDCEPLHKVTIIPRGPALGSTMMLPEKDKYLQGRRKLLGELMVMYGGRISEEVFFGDITSGAQNDIERATRIATMMVCEWGMSEVIGPINYSGDEERLFLGAEIRRSANHSQATGEKIDAEIKKIITEVYERARKLIEEKRAEVVRLADALLKYETLDANEIDTVLEGHELDRPTGEERRKGNGNPKEPEPAAGIAKRADVSVPDDPRTDDVSDGKAKLSDENA